MKATTSALLLAAILACALFFRSSFISHGLPYFYAEDEAHHFNRVVEMVKNGDYNPKYFHKPSLHFYLRMPVVAAGFIWGVRAGHLKKVEEIKTRDTFGIASYALVASHPGIVKWNRAFSVLLSILTCLLVFDIVRRWLGQVWPGLVAASLFALSPEAIAYSAIIGVDVPMTFFCVACVWAAIYYFPTTDKTWLAGILVSVLAGAAVSSKYDALPIFIVPLAFVALKKFSSIRLALALILPWLAFLAFSPFILAELPLFLNHLAYEIWHYGIAGHVGHQANPGIEQAWFYILWLANSALGYVALVLTLVGIFSIVKSKRPQGIIILLFPLLYFILMSAQRANFERNMLVIIPFIACLAAAGALTLVELLTTKFKQYSPGLIACVLSFLVLAQPLVLSAKQEYSINFQVESRIEIEQTLKALETKPTAVAGELQLSTEILSRPGLTRIRAKTTAIETLYLDGYQNLLLPGDLHKDNDFYQSVKTWPGQLPFARIIINPSATLFQQTQLSLSQAVLALQQTSIQTLKLKEELQAKSQEFLLNPSSENFVWLTAKLVKVDLASLKQLKLMSPWSGQEVSIGTLATQYQIPLADQPGSWSSSWQIPKELNNNSQVYMLVKVVNSPKELRMSEDSRRLGVALQAE